LREGRRWDGDVLPEPARTRQQHQNPAVCFIERDERASIECHATRASLWLFGGLVASRREKFVGPTTLSAGERTTRLLERFRKECSPSCNVAQRNLDRVLHESGHAFCTSSIDNLPNRLELLSR
jgi:hypothetical protein